jgi:hypothetical protein
MFFDESWLGNFLILSKTVSRTIPRYGLFRDRHTSFGSGPALIFSFIGTGAFVELEVALHSTSPPSKSWVAAMLGQVTHSWSTFSTISVKISRRSSYLIPWIQVWIVNSTVQESLRIKPLRRRHTSKLDDWVSIVGWDVREWFLALSILCLQITKMEGAAEFKTSWWDEAGLVSGTRPANSASLA